MMDVAGKLKRMIEIPAPASNADSNWYQKKAKTKKNAKTKRNADIPK
jgi:hypothetical protein